MKISKSVRSYRKGLITADHFMLVVGVGVGNQAVAARPVLVDHVHVDRREAGPVGLGPGALPPLDPHPERAKALLLGVNPKYISISTMHLGRTDLSFQL